MNRYAGWLCAVAAMAACGLAAAAAAQPGPAKVDVTSPGQTLTPAAAKGALFQPLNPDLPDLPAYTAGQASAVALSPDGRTLLIVTSGFNRMFGANGKFIDSQSKEYVFVYDVSGAAPVKRQVLTMPNTFIGIGWAPGGKAFYVSGGVDDDVVEFTRGEAGFAKARTFPLGHKVGLGLMVKPEAAGLAVSPDGKRLLVANLQNDSVSLIDLSTGAVREQDLRPGAIDPKRAGQPGGSVPRAVIWTSDARAYVASERDREIIPITVTGDAMTVGARIRTAGQPVAFALNRAATRLYAAIDNTDGVAVIDPNRNRLVETIPSAAPAALLPKGKALGGAGSNSLALSPDGRTLLVTNGGENAVAVIKLSDRAAGAGPVAARKGKDDDDDDKPAPDRSAVVGLIPTGWYPTGVAVRPDGRQLYVVNGKSIPGPNPDGCRNQLTTGPHAEDACRATNEYVWQKEKAGFLILPPPSGAELGRLTQRVALNNGLIGGEKAEADGATMQFLRAHIHHVIYIVKENRTYDQVLGDLEVGNGDPRLTVFGRAMTPNQHALARQFVDLDAFYDSGESSNTGWNWTTAARTNDYTERAAPVNYADRGLQYDQEGANRGINVGYATTPERVAANPVSPNDPNLLPGANDVAAPDGPAGEAGRGYIWDSALRAGLSVRNYGFYGDLTRYYLPPATGAAIPLERDPHKAGLQVLYVTKPALMDKTDPYFRGFDQSFPDYWRFKEWEREFDGYVAKGELPSLILTRLAHDHTGNFGKGIDGVNTVETELADNDYAVGLVIQKVAHSPFAKDTLIFVIEDDAQDGPDHVDAHRSIAFVAGPYVKQGAVVSHRYTTVNLLRTIEAVLGTEPMGLNDALAGPMTEVFDTTKADWSYEAKVPAVLRTTALPLPPLGVGEAACTARPRHSAAWWDKAMKGQNFNEEDRLNTAAFNRALWLGLKGDAPYPKARSGKDLSKNRVGLVKAGVCGQ
jgi:DNA-binding beta-propeller fold protein YncE